MVDTSAQRRADERERGRDRAHVGKRLPPSTVVIERGPVTNFARAVKDENPVYLSTEAARAAGFDAIPIPPTYGFAMGHWGTFPEAQPDGASDDNPIGAVLGDLMRGGGLILHGEQEFRYHGTIEVGDTLTSSGRISDVYEKTSGSGAAMTFVVTETDYHNQRDEHVLTTVMTLIHRA